MIDKEKTQSVHLQNFAQFGENNKLSFLSDYLQKGVAQFNVFSIRDIHARIINCSPYNRTGCYKISLINGPTKLFYADKYLEIINSGLFFSNPNVPYSWEHIGQDHTGYFCVFNQDFFNSAAQISDYPTFKLGNLPLFELTAIQTEEITDIFLQMLSEIKSDFTYKYDVLRNRVLDVIFKALKMRPSIANQYNDSNGTTRIASLFVELLERQFPIDSPMHQINFRFPSEFAEQLGLHVNHLNISLKKITGKTTSQLISERILQEARNLLKHTDWNISEIARCLKFSEAAQFTNFFKKNEILSPKSFRKGFL